MKRFKGQINVYVEITSTGYSAYCEQWENNQVYTTGSNFTELMENLIESINFMLEDNDLYIGEENLKFNLDFRQFFEYYKFINSKYLAEKIGMNPSLLSQYVQGKKVPSLKQKSKIIDGLNTIGRELSALEKFRD